MKQNFAAMSLILLFAFLIRAAGLAAIPPALNSDEILKAFDGASVYRTGMDHHGETWPLFFKQSGEYSPPLYIYFAGLFSAPFGVNPYTVRLPSAILGTLSVLLIYLYMRELAGKQAGLVASCLVTISPWNVHYSRMGWEAISFIPLLLGGLYLFLRWSRSYRIENLIGSSVCFALTLYTYPAARLFVPLLFLGLLILYAKDLWQHRRQTIAALIIIFLIKIPYLYVLFENYDAMQARFHFLSVFQLNNGWLVFLQNYFLHLSPMFLFIKGDANALHMMAGGVALLVLLPFFFIGLVEIFRSPQKDSKILIVWFAIFAIPSSMTFDRYDPYSMPNALRASCGMTLIEIISAVGIMQFLTWLHGERIRRIASALIVLAIMINAAVIVYDYIFKYPIYSAPSFQYGLSETVQYLEERKQRWLENDSSKIVVSPQVRLHPVTLATFAGKEPAPFDANDFPRYIIPFFNYVPVYTDFGLAEYGRMGNIVRWYTQSEGKNFIVVTSREITVGEPEERFYYPDGSVAYEVYESFK